jgi:hypothetical protein
LMRDSKGLAALRDAEGVVLSVVHRGGRCDVNDSHTHLVQK